MLGYWFSSDTLRNGSPIPPVNEWLEWNGPIIPCKSGLHASEEPFDALQYAPGPLLHRVELDGDLIPHGDPVDKWVGRRRRILATIDAAMLCREFARSCALQVAGLWNIPIVVYEYLNTGREDLREIARDTAWAIKGDATETSAMATAWAATGISDMAAALFAAGNAANTIAENAARDVDEGRVCDVDWDVAWDMAKNNAWEAQRQKFREVVEAAFTQQCTG